jgi:hypothetical protein
MPTSSMSSKFLLVSHRARLDVRAEPVSAPDQGRVELVEHSGSPAVRHRPLICVDLGLGAPL